MAAFLFGPKFAGQTPVFAELTDVNPPRGASRWIASSTVPSYPRKDTTLRSSARAAVLRYCPGRHQSVATARREVLPQTGCG